MLNELAIKALANPARTSVMAIPIINSISENPAAGDAADAWMGLDSWVRMKSYLLRNADLIFSYWKYAPSALVARNVSMRTELRAQGAPACGVIHIGLRGGSEIEEDIAAMNDF